MENKNIEVEAALHTIELLKKYAVETDAQKKDQLLQQLHDANKLVYLYVTHRNFAPLELATNIERAIKQNMHRPKNMSIAQLAVSSDLDYIGGQFNTFDSELSQMVKHKENPTSIRTKFQGATANLHYLAKQFSNDWIRRLNNHADLVTAVRNADDSIAAEAYDYLFWVLTQDFSKEYNGIQIHSRVVTDWSKSDIRPSDNNAVGGHVRRTGTFLRTKNMSEVDVQRLTMDCEKNPDNHKVSLVRVNITNVKKAFPNPDDFFYAMIGTYAHEMHHALDALNPREGALGPQVAQIDKDTFIPIGTDKEQNFASATEISSYTIGNTLFNQLKNTRF